MKVGVFSNTLSKRPKKIKICRSHLWTRDKIHNFLYLSSGKWKPLKSRIIKELKIKKISPRGLKSRMKAELKFLGMKNNKFKSGWTALERLPDLKRENYLSQKGTYFSNYTNNNSPCSNLMISYTENIPINIPYLQLSIHNIFFSFCSNE